MLVCECKYSKFTDHQGDSDTCNMLNGNIDILKYYSICFCYFFFRAMPPVVKRHVPESKPEGPLEGSEHDTETGNQFSVLSHLTEPSVTGNINFTFILENMSVYIHSFS
jgi:hypothetical protein